MNRNDWNALIFNTPLPTHLRMPVPADRRPLYPFEIRKAEIDRIGLLFETSVVDGVLRWTSVDRVVPPHVLLDAGLEVPQEQADAYDAETRRALDAYRRNPPRLTAEQKAEALAELGPDAIDVITGRRIADQEVQ